MNPTADSERVVNVAVARPIQNTLTYRVPPEWSDIVGPGTRVRVPLGRQIVAGVVLEFADSSSTTATLKLIEDLVDPEQPFQDSQIRLAQWMSDYYLCPIGEVFSAMGGGRGAKGETRYSLARTDWSDGSDHIQKLTPTERSLLSTLQSGKPVTLTQIIKAGIKRAAAHSGLRRLESRGLVMSEWTSRQPPIPADASINGLANGHEADIDEETRIALQRAQTSGGIGWTEVAEDIPGGKRHLRELMKTGRVAWDPMPARTSEFDKLVSPEPGAAELDPDQTVAASSIIAALDSAQFRAQLLWGPTGSGKTAVYCEAIRQAWRLGKRVLFLVPEIGLAGPMIARLQATLHEPIGVWHSALTPSQRYWIGQHVQSGRYRLVVGARSAILAPLPDCGLIIVDEEHADAYKQSDPAPRYHARDVAVVRAQMSNAVCVLGSATPSSESYHNAHTEKFDLLRLTRRVQGRQMPLVQLVDLSRRSFSKRGDWLTDDLRDAITSTIAAGRKVIVFINRRGYASMVGCQDCGHTAQCPNCALTLTFHASDNTIRCHLCTYSKSADQVCPECKSSEFVFHGVGTQRVEEALVELGENVRPVRLDADIAAKRGAAEDVLAGFAGDRYNLLLGTQMVAKGLDIARVGLVGVIWADQHMAFPDFRAEERTFQLLTQVAGRAGRDSDTDGVARVLIQTFHPQHDLIELAAAQDTSLFFERELPRREELKYPPFSHLVLLAFSGNEQDRVKLRAASFAKFWGQAVEGMDTPPGTLLGPAPGAIARRSGEYQFHVLIKAAQLKQTRHVVAEFREKVSVALRKESVRLTIDVDPVDFW